MQMQQNKRIFGEWLEKEMRARRLSDRAMAELFARKDGEAGITHASIGRWRRGEAEPSPDNIEELCRILGVQPRLIYALLGRIQPYETKHLLTPQQIAIVEAVLSDLTEEEIGVLAANVDFFAARRKQTARTPPSVPATSGGSA